MAYPAFSHHFFTPTSVDGIMRFPQPRIALAHACPGPTSEFSTRFSNTPADISSEVLAVAPGVDSSLALSDHAPCIFVGVITLDDASFTTEIAVHGRANAHAPFSCVALPDTGSPQTFIRRDTFDSMLSVGVVSVPCKRKCIPQSWGGFGESAPLQASTSVHLSVHVFQANEPTCSLTECACVVPPSMMQHAVLLGCDSWMHLNNRSYRSLPPQPSNHRILGDLELSHHVQAGVWAYAIDPVASGGSFHRRYDGTVGVTPSDEPQPFAVNLVRSNGSQALTGH